MGPGNEAQTGAKPPFENVSVEGLLTRTKSGFCREKYVYMVRIRRSVVRAHNLFTYFARKNARRVDIFLNDMMITLENKYVGTYGYGRIRDLVVILPCRYNSLLDKYYAGVSIPVTIRLWP